jgi:RNA polymerase sigma-70 factor (sigma-E family)
MAWRRVERDETDFAALVADLTGPLLRTAYLLCYDLAEAEDLVQETWARMAKRWQRGGAVDSPAAYAHRVLVNAAIDSQPARGRRRAELHRDKSGELPEPADPGSIRSLHAVDDQDVLARALTRLPRRQRAVVVLRYFDDLPEQEVASVLGCSPGTVKSTASRALHALRTSLGESPDAAAPSSIETADLSEPGETKACGR